MAQANNPLDEFPQVVANHAGQGFEKALTDLMDMFQPFLDKFGSPPDERGLTDRALFYMALHVGKMRLERYSVSEETVNGCDFALKFWAKNIQTSQPEKRAIYLQAKTFKHDKQTDWLVADFMAMTRGKHMQLQLVANTVTANQRADATVIGGYIVYAPDWISFFPLSELQRRYNVCTAAYGNLAPDDPNKRGSVALYCNRYMSKYFYESRKEYSLQDIFTSSG